MKVCHIISSLEIGGAQKILAQLCARLPDQDLQFVVISLTRETRLATELREAGCVVHCLDLRGFGTFVQRFGRLLRILRLERPDLVQTWLYHADLLGSVAARLTGHQRIVWTVHHANADFAREGRGTKHIVKILAKWSGRLPERIIYCSPSAQKVHEVLGYEKARGWVILNGIDEAAFRPDAHLRGRFRQDLGVGDDTHLVGIVGRFSPLKGYDVFLDMAQQVAARTETPIAFVLAGTDVTAQNDVLVSAIAKRGLLNQCHLLGERDDMAALMNGLDVLACPSYSESFGLVLAEALACGTPAVASDLEATSDILAPDRLVPVGDAASLAETVIVCLQSAPDEAEKEELRANATRRFGLAPMIAKYRSLYSRTHHAQQSHGLSASAVADLPSDPT